MSTSKVIQIGGPFDNGGNIRVSLVGFNGGTGANVAPPSDAVGNQNGLVTQAFQMVWDAVNTQWVRLRAAITYKPVNVALVANTDAAIWTPGAGKKFRVMGWVLAFDAAFTGFLRDGAGGAHFYEMSVGAGVQMPSPPNMVNGLLSAVANNAVTAQATGAGNLRGMIFGTEE